MNVEEFHLLKRLPINTRLPTCGARSTPMSGSGSLLNSARTSPSIPWRKLRLTSSDKEASAYARSLKQPERNYVTFPNIPRISTRPRKPSDGVIGR
jgi:hypothetical protein